MKKLTELQQAFCVNKAAGLKNKDAAIAAGYSPLAADQTASSLMGRADIKAGIRAAKKNLKGIPPLPGAAPSYEEEVDAKNKMPKGKYDDPVTFLEDVMNHKLLPVAMRADAAKQLLPYKHARIGETGKKDSARQRAEKVAGTATPGKKPKFAPKQAPSLKLVVNS